MTWKSFLKPRTALFLAGAVLALALLVVPLPLLDTLVSQFGHPGDTIAFAYNVINPSARFFRLFVSGGEEFDQETRRIQDAFDAWPSAPGGASRRANAFFLNLIIDNNLTPFKRTAQPGDEVLLYYSGHGGDGQKSGAWDTDRDDPDGFDNHITSRRPAGERPVLSTVTDDDLTRKISGFRKSVNIVVILNSCLGGTFADGGGDLPSATDADGDRYGSHLTLIGPPQTIRNELTNSPLRALENVNGRPRADSNGNGVVSGDELRQFLDAEGTFTGPGQGGGKRCSEPEEAFLP